MDCKDFRSKIYNYFDNELSDEEKVEFFNHIDICENCKKEFEFEKNLKESIDSLTMEELPKEYCKKFHEKLLLSTKNDVNKHNKKNKLFLKYFGLVASIIIVFVGIIWGINDSFKSNDFTNMARREGIEEKTKNIGRISNDSMCEMANEQPKEDDCDTDGTDYNSKDNQYNGLDKSSKKTNSNKIIVSGDMTVNTYDYNEFYEYLIKLIKDNKGYFESSRTYTNNVIDNKKFKNGEIVLRIPQELFYNIIGLIEQNCEVESKGTNEKDVTKHYYEVDNIIKNLNAQEENLRRLYNKAETVSEILQVENELRRVRTEIDSYSIELTNIDDRVSMSKLNLYVREIEKPSLSVESGINVWKEAKEGFIKSIKSVIEFFQCVLIYIVSILPYILIVFVLVIIALVVFFKKRKLKK